MSTPNSGGLIEILTLNGHMLYTTVEHFRPHPYAVNTDLVQVMGGSHHESTPMNI